MPIINSIVNWFNVKRLHQIELFRQYPFDVQKETLIHLVQQARDTRFGTQYGFQKIHTVSAFQESVKIHTYEDMSAHIRKVMEGEQNVLWPTEIRWFAKSSGTTNDKSKFIPVSQEILEDCHYRGGKDILAFYMRNYPESRILTGKSLTLGGSHQINQYNENSFYGDLSAILIDNLPFWADFIKTPRQEIALMDKWEEKLKHLSDATISENVTSIAGVPSWVMVLLKYILDKTGKSNLLEVWPNLEVFFHGGISFTPYRDQYRALIPSEGMHYMETYNASEGFFAIQDDPASDDMLLMLDYDIFYEFVPVEDIFSSNPKALTVADVETGKNYAMVITTSGGLWRYMIGDTVTFTSLYPHKIKITGRTKLFINAFGEEVILDNAEKALKAACDATSAQIHEYTAGPVFMTGAAKGRHEWLIEFEREPRSLAKFSEVLDQTLRSINSDYDAKRYKDITLDPPLVKSLKKGSFYNWFNDKGKLGGQNKMPRLWNDRRYLEEMHSIQEKLGRQ
ncbi:MAG: GH3 auxin-responsive promoter family protein [Bacteroidales bacterium]